jgi:type VI secretion system ImpC/EvpB family protein
MEFDLGFGRRDRPRDGDEPMRLLVLGDFSGSPAVERPPLATRPTHRVDSDNLDDVLRRYDPRLSAQAGDVRFSCIDDFHPDQLYARLDLFQTLRKARTATPSETADLLGRLIGKPADSSPAPATTGLDALIRDVVAPHIVKDTTAQASAHVAGVDAAIAEQMRALLHAAAFQSLEAAWRGVQWAVSNLELDDTLQMHLFDVTREELLADVVAAQGQLAQTGVYRALVDRWRNVPGGEGWSAFVGLMQFGPSDSDVGLLAALGLIASQAGAPFLAGADLSLAGDTANASGGWPSLRQSEAAAWIGLAAPRFLLRLPYGQKTDRIDAFAFEEITGPPVLQHFLWGTSSLAMAVLIGRAFSARGWDMTPGDERELGDLPAYTYVRDGEREMQPCGERLLTESQIDTFLKAGLVPIASRVDRNGVVAVRFQSIASPPAPLAW